MKNTKIFLIAALLGSVLAGCQTEIEVEPVDNTPWTLTVNAAMDPVTKAMSLDGNTLKAYWVVDEEVGVYLGGTKLGTIKVAEITKPDNTEAILTGTLNIEGLKVNDKIMLLFPDKNENVWSYLGQDGSAPSESGTMAKGYDYATATLTVDGLDPDIKNVVPGGKATFANEQSVYRLRFKDNGTYFNVSSISLVASQNKIVRSRSYVENAWTSACGVLTMDPTVTPSNNLYYMAIRNENTTENDNYTFTVIRSSDNAVLEGVKAIPAEALAGPSYIPTSVAVTQKTLEQASGTISNANDVL